MKRGLKVDWILAAVLVAVLAGVPYGIYRINRQVISAKVPPQARMFTLTGHSERGWMLAEARAYDALNFWKAHGQPVGRPVIRVSKGDQVVLRLTSSDVVHGFSLKEFGVFVTDGIQPGKSLYVSFTADKPGTFTFSCNAICGDIHENMQGTLIVTA